MLKQLFGKRATTQTDVVIAVVAAVLGIFKAADTIHTYKTEQAEENEK